jgi:hypothetical protein
LTHGIPPHDHIPLGKQNPKDKTNTSAIPYDNPIPIERNFMGKRLKSKEFITT